MRIRTASPRTLAVLVISLITAAALIATELASTGRPLAVFILSAALGVLVLVEAYDRNLTERRLASALTAHETGIRFLTDQTPAVVYLADPGERAAGTP